MVSRSKLLFSIIFILILTTSCNFPGFNAEILPGSSSPVQAGGSDSPGTLSPAGTVVGINGVTISADTEAISTDQQVWIEELDQPVLNADAPSGANQLGSYYQVGAEMDVFTASGTAFQVKLPLPEGTDPDQLFLGVLEPGEALISELNCEGAECPDDISIENIWVLIPVEFIESENAVYARIARLTPRGRTLALFSSTEENTENSRLAGKLASAAKQQGAQYNASCTNFSGSGVNCTSTTRSALENEMEDAHSTYAGLGFGSPYLQQDSSGQYQFEIRPYYTSTDQDIDIAVCEREMINNSQASLAGVYSSTEQTIIVCVESSSVSSPERDAARHELFHAVQYNYPQVRNNPHEDWIIEGSATAAENSDTGMKRDFSRPYHLIEDSLQSSRGTVAYQAQDFWVYLGLSWDLGLDYLIDLFENGADTAAVESTFQGDWPGGLTLGDAYWNWTRNQAYENHQDYGGAFLRSSCQPDPDVSSLETIDYNFGSPPGDQTYTLQPLESKLIEINFLALGDLSYTAGIDLNATSPEIRSIYYLGGASDCRNQPPSQSQVVNIDPGQPRTYYLLVSHTGTGAPQNFTVSFSPDQGALEILEPDNGTVFDEGETIDFLALASGLSGGSPGTFQLNWFYFDYRGTQIGFGTSGNGEYFPYDGLCDGSYEITAEAINARTSETASDTVTLTVNDLGASTPPDQCAPEVKILSPGAGDTVRAGDFIQLRSEIDDDHPETDDPLYPVTWRANGPNGPVLASGLAASVELSAGVNAIYVSYGAASDAQPITVLETENTKPTPIIQQPSNEAQFSWSDPGAGINGITINLQGKGTDPEDGNLPGGSLRWSYREQGSGDWINLGTGSRTSTNIRYKPGWTTYEIKLTATDAGNLSASTTIQIRLQGPPS